MLLFFPFVLFGLEVLFSFCIAVIHNKGKCIDSRRVGRLRSDGHVFVNQNSVFFATISITRKVRA